MAPKRSAADADAPAPAPAEAHEPTPEEIAKRVKRAKAVARRRGYRGLAERAGYNDKAEAPSRATAAHAIRISEITRACQWAPKIPDAIAYDTLEEFKARTDLSYAPVTRSVAHAIRQGAEVFARAAMNEAVLRTYEQGKTRVTGATMWSVLRPYKNAFDFNWATPAGMVRHAQTTTVGSGERETTALGILEGDEEAMKIEATLRPKQTAYAKTKREESDARKAKRAKMLTEGKKAREAAA